MLPDGQFCICCRSLRHVLIDVYHSSPSVRQCMCIHVKSVSRPLEASCIQMMASSRLAKSGRSLGLGCQPIN